MESQPNPDSAANAHRDWLLLGLVIVFGAALRLCALDVQSLWNDELSSWAQSNYPTLTDVIELGVRNDVHPPGYQLALYFVIHGIGDSETALRLPSAIAGVLAIAAIYALGVQLYSRREALIAAALLAFSYQPIYFSQEARAYSLLLLFSILSTHYWFRITRALDGERPIGVGAQLGYLACAITTSYLHYFGLLLVAVQLAGWAMLFVTRPRALGRVVLLGLLTAAAYLPWLPYFLEEFGAVRSHFDEPGIHTLTRYWRFLFYNPGEQLKWFALAVFAIAAGRGLAEAMRLPERRPLRAVVTSPTALLIAWLVVPFAIAFVRSKMSLPMINDRNLLISLPAAFLLFARAITAIIRDGRLQAVTTGAIVAILLHGLFVTGRYYTEPRKEQFREAAQVVALREHEFPNATVIAHAWSKGKFDYYLERLGADARVDLLAGTGDDLDRLRAHLTERRPAYVWFLLGHKQPDPTFIETLDRELELLSHTPLHGTFTRLYRAPQ